MAVSICDPTGICTASARSSDLFGEPGSVSSRSLACFSGVRPTPGAHATRLAHSGSSRYPARLHFRSFLSKDSLEFLFRPSSPPAKIHRDGDRRLSRGTDMAQLLHPVEPFGEVNVHPQRDGSLQIVATVLMEPDI